MFRPAGPVHVEKVAENNQAKYVDPDGRTGSFPYGSGQQNTQWEKTEAAKEGVKFDDPLVSMNLKSPFGERDDADPTDHDGIDLQATKGTPVFASEAGTVREADLISPRSKDGNSYLIIDHKGKWETRYPHMDSFSVKAGDKVFKGQLVGYSGTRANVPPHLHFEIRNDNIPKNPEEFLKPIPRKAPTGPFDIYHRTK
jgi:murein DD-endopeptidase MepM/ murein hydrolase activator NlpD